MRLSCFATVVGSALMLGSVGFAQLPATHSLSMDATVTSTGGATKSSSALKTDLGGQPVLGGIAAETDDYTQKRAKESGIALLVQVRNLGRAPDSAKVEWYFFAKPIEKGREYIFDSGNQNITVAPATAESIPVKSAPIKSLVVKQLHTTDGVNSLGQQILPSASVKKTGSTVGGWIVRLIIDGKPGQIRASSPSLETLAKNESALSTYPRSAK